MRNKVKSTKNKNFKPISILFVDDEETNLLATKALLENNIPNLICDTINNGFDAINMCLKNSYDLILMDIEMPDMCGIATSKKIRKFNKDILIIAYTSLNCKNKKQEALEIGISSYLLKSTNQNLLLNYISQYLDN